MSQLDSGAHWLFCVRFRPSKKKTDSAAAGVEPGHSLVTVPNFRKDARAGGEGGGEREHGGGKLDLAEPDS